MKTAAIADRTLCSTDRNYSFKEKLEITRLLARLSVDVIELPEIADENMDILLVKTIGAFVSDYVLSVAAGSDEKSIENAAAAIAGAVKSRIRIEVPVSPVMMEFVAKRKPKDMLLWIPKAVELAKASGHEVEVSLLDATRAEKDFLKSAVNAAEEAGAAAIGLFDSTGGMLPGEFSAFVDEIAEGTELPVSVCCSDEKGLGLAGALTALTGKAAGVKTAVNSNITDTEDLLSLISEGGNRYGVTTSVSITELHRVSRQIQWVQGSDEKATLSAATVSGTDDLKIDLDKNEDKDSVLSAVKKLGYDLSAEDETRVYDAFLATASRKKVGAKELEAIVAATALQVPPTYTLESFVINNSNIFQTSAQITLRKGEEVLRGICLGNGPVDAAFLAIEQIVGHHYDVEEFQIQAVTEGKEALGQAFIKLRDGVNVYSATGISTDIVGASIRAYIGALNKIAYEEVQ